MTGEELQQKIAETEDKARQINAPLLKSSEQKGEWGSSFEDDENPEFDIILPFRQFRVYAFAMSAPEIDEYDKANERITDELLALRTTPGETIEDVKSKSKDALRITADQNRIADDIFDAKVVRIMESDRERDKSKMKRVARAPLIDLLVATSRTGRGASD